MGNGEFENKDNAGGYDSAAAYSAWYNQYYGQGRQTQAEQSQAQAGQQTQQAGYYGQQQAQQSYYAQGAQPAQEYTGADPWNMYSPGIELNQPLPRYSGAADSSSSGGNSPRRSGGALRFVRAVALVVVCALCSAVAAYAVTDYRFSNGDFTPNTTQVVLGGNKPEPAYVDPEPYMPPQVALLPESSISAQDIYDIALTQVVGISVTAPASSGWFGISEMSPSVVGSGFVISSDGYILTNHHVIEMAYEREYPVSVIMHNGDSFDAEIIGFVKDSDVAVLKIDQDGLNPAFIGDSSNLRVGQSVYAVGNPFGDLVYTMTDGIVSALDRVVSVEGKTINAFQFSAAVNSGNSGGPVYNTSGEVIGIVTAKVIRGSVEGIGFAIPINDAIDIATDLIEHGYVKGRPLLGVTVRTVTPAHADYFGWVTGAFVLSIAEGSAAYNAGIELGDIITGIGDEAVPSVDGLGDVLRTYRAGDTAKITVWRDGESVDLFITFDENQNAGKPGETDLTIDFEVDPFEDFPG